MIWMTECRRVRQLLALWAGRDLDDRGTRTARRHVSECPGCREHLQKLNFTRSVLERVTSDESRSEGGSGESLWGGIRERLQAERLRAAERAAEERARSAGWLPVGALAAACVVVVMISRLDMAVGPRIANQGSMTGARLVPDRSWERLPRIERSSRSRDPLELPAGFDLPRDWRSSSARPESPYPSLAPAEDRLGY